MTLFAIENQWMQWKTIHQFKSCLTVKMLFGGTIPNHDAVGQAYNWNAFQYVILPPYGGQWYMPKNMGIQTIFSCLFHILDCSAF